MVKAEQNGATSIKKIDFDNLKQEEFIEYNDGDIFLIEDMNKLPANIQNNVIEVEAIVVVFCTLGKGKVTINEREYVLQQGQMLVTLPHATYANLRPLTREFQSRVFGVSAKAFENSVFVANDIWKVFYYLLNNPVIELNEEEMRLFSHYYELIKIKTRQKGYAFRREIMVSIIQSVTFELLSIINRFSNSAYGSASMSQGDILFKRFIEMLTESEGRIRSVAQFAERLCITPKYLSAVVKNASGRSALDLIHENATRAIVRQLRYTDKSIKEISNELQFPSLSFFGKFVKSQLGMSPKDFRKRR